MSKPTAADIEWKSAAINSLASRLDAAQEEIDTQAAEIKRLRDALEVLAKLGNGDHYGNSEGNRIAQAALKEQDND